MAVNISCPTCGHTFCQVHNAVGQQELCPSCLNQFPHNPPPAASLLARSDPAPAAPMTPPNRTLLAEPEAMLRYTCPRCKKSLESPVSFAGQKLNCPDCNQRIQVPQSPKLPPPVNKTILAEAEAPTVPVAPPFRSQPQSAPPIPMMTVQLVEESSSTPSAPARRENCLECGKDVTNRTRIQSCPDCGSNFCSAQCYREHRHHAHAPREKSRTRYVECAHCGSTARPYRNTAISQAGWITFVLLLIFFFPLFWIGLLMTETRLTCADCGTHLR